LLRPVGTRRGDKFLGLDLSANLLPKYRSQIRRWRSNGATIHMLVYDLLPITRPEWFTRRTVRNFREWFDVVVYESDTAICISKHVKRELQEQIRRRKPEARIPITSIRLGGDIGASVPSIGRCIDIESLLDRLRFRAAILLVGTVEPRKGYDVALAAFEHLWLTRGGDAPDMVIVGKDGSITGEAPTAS
jgi:glycosyltransferase involved in cell wall biosynthesis